jgi:hypothetical protein
MWCRKEHIIGTAVIGYQGSLTTGKDVTLYVIHMIEYIDLITSYTETGLDDFLSDGRIEMMPQRIRNNSEAS